MKLMTVEETAEQLKRSPGAIRNLVLRRKIPYRKVGGRLVFLPEEIEVWVMSSPGKTLEEILKGLK